VLTYTIGILVNKVVTLVILGAGLLLTGHAVLTPLLQALSVFTNDFVSMARTADRATPSPRPNAWRVRNLTIAAVPLASFKFLFCLGVLAAGALHFDLSTGQIQTLTFIMFVFAGHALVYVLRERGHMWNSRPSLVLMLFSLADIVIVAAVAIFCLVSPALPASLVLILLAATCVFAVLLDQVKVAVFRLLPVD
jgi:H+-transporting ATPase